MIKVLFVCLGNICRSPLAEEVFRDLVKSEGLASKISCDSCGTSRYHIGELAHHLSRDVAVRNGLELTHKARQLKSEDFSDFDYLIGMDNQNIQNMKNLRGAEKSNQKIFLMREFDNAKSKKAVSDPYGGDEADFDDCYEILHESCKNFLNQLKVNHNL